MRTRTGAGTWVAAVLLAAAALVVPAAARATAAPMTGTATALDTAPPTPSPTPTLAFPCKTAPTSPTAPPNTPPSAPGTPEVVGVFMNSVRLKWAPATDEDGIACYYVREMRNGTPYVVASFQPAVTEGDVYLPWPPAGVASQVHELHVVAIDAKGALGPASGTVAVTIYNDVITSPSASPQPTCRVQYRPVTWPGGMTANIAITNTGTTAVRDWRLTFTFPDSGQRVTWGWVATWAQTGAQVTATAPNWNKDIAPGQTLNIGFNGEHSGANPDPAKFFLNGAACA